MPLQLDPALAKQIPMSPHKKEIAVFTLHGVTVTALGFLAADASGWFTWVLWIMFTISLIKLGGDYHKVLQRPEEELRVYIPK